MSRKWKLRVRHILDAIDRVQAYTQGMDLDAFGSDMRTMDAVIRNLQVIGEAARLVPEELQKSHPEIPWRLMRGMRHVLVHEYDRVNAAVVWDTIHANLPPLVPLLQRILDEEPGE